MRELLRLRWGPGRVGKTCALYLEVIARTGEATLSEIAERTGRRQDNVRRALVEAEARRLVECSEETYRLVPEFAAALAKELKETGIVDSERLDRQRYERQQRAYREAWRAGAIKKARWRDFYRKWEKRNPEPGGFIEDLKPLETLQKPSAPNPVITDAQDPEQLRLLAALAREHIAEYRRKHLPPPPSEPAARLLCRLWRVDPDCFAAIRHDPRRLAWEVSGRGWTRTLYSGNTMRAALNLLEPELVAV